MSIDLRLGRKTVPRRMMIGRFLRIYATCCCAAGVIPGVCRENGRAIVVPAWVPAEARAGGIATALAPGESSDG